MKFCSLFVNLLVSILFVLAIVTLIIITITFSALITQSLRFAVSLISTTHDQAVVILEVIQRLNLCAEADFLKVLYQILVQLALAQTQVAVTIYLSHCCRAGH